MNNAATYIYTYISQSQRLSAQHSTECMSWRTLTRPDLLNGRASTPAVKFPMIYHLTGTSGRRRIVAHRANGPYTLSTDWFTRHRRTCQFQERERRCDWWICPAVLMDAKLQCRDDAMQSAKVSRKRMMFKPPMVVTGILLSGRLVVGLEELCIIAGVDAG